MSLLNTSPIAVLEGGTCEDRIISHEVKELGEHRYIDTSICFSALLSLSLSLSLSSLICSATYTVHTSGEELFLRKFFKFNVQKSTTLMYLR